MSVRPLTVCLLEPSVVEMAEKPSWLPLAYPALCYKGIPVFSEVLFCGIKSQTLNSSNFSAFLQHDMIVTSDVSLVWPSSVYHMKHSLTFATP